MAERFDLPIGARSLAEAMALAMAPDGPAPQLSLPETRAYLVIGSTDPITLTQLQRLREDRPDLVYISAPNGQAPENLPERGRLNLVHATPGQTQADAPSVALALARTLARLKPEPGALLVLSGGATAQVILKQFGIRVLELVGEAQPGLPLARAGGYTVITKSGGFGDPDTLVRLAASFSSLGRQGHRHGG